MCVKLSNISGTLYYNINTVALRIITGPLQDVRDHRLLVFKDQGVLAPERHLEIGRWFGQIESTFYDHPKSPHRDIFRVSNDRTEGLVHSQANT